MTRAPQDLMTRAVWAPEDARGGPSIAYVSERRRYQLTLACLPLAGLLALVGWLAGLPAAAVLLLVALPLLAGTVVTMTGRSGYYALDRSGRPDRYLGRRAPDLSEHRRLPRAAAAGAGSRSGA